MSKEPKTKVVETEYLSGRDLTNATCLLWAKLGEYLTIDELMDRYCKRVCKKHFLGGERWVATAYDNRIMSAITLCEAVYRLAILIELGEAVEIPVRLSEGEL